MRIPNSGAVSVFSPQPRASNLDARSFLGHALTQYLLEKLVQPTDTPAQALLRFVGFAERWLRQEASGVTAAEAGLLVVLQDGTELPIVPVDSSKLPVSETAAANWNLTTDVYRGPVDPSQVTIKTPT